MLIVLMTYQKHLIPIGKLLCFSILISAIGFGIFALFLEFSLRSSLLQALDLPVTPDHMSRARDLMRMPYVEDIPEAREKEFFARAVSYNELMDDGLIQVSLYRERIQKIPNWSEDILRIQQRAKRSGVILRVLPDREAFREALKTDDVVLFSGHSNLGQGLTVRSGKGETDVLWQVEGANPPYPIPEKYLFTEESVEMAVMPKVENKVFLHLGCRSELYYSHPFIKQSPETFFLFTNYEWAPGTELARAVDLLCQSLEKRQSLDVLIKHWEELYKSEVLTGRSRQIRKYPLEKDFPGTLFQTVPPQR